MAPVIKEQMGNTEVDDARMDSEGNEDNADTADTVDTVDTVDTADSVDRATVGFVAPLFWSRAADVEWMYEMHKTQERMDELACKEDLLGLLEQHPQGVDFVREFQATDVERGVEHLELLMSHAADGVDEADKVSATATAEIAGLVKQLKEEDPAQVKTALDERRRECLKQVKQRSDALRSVDLNSEELPAQILIAEFGESERKRIEMMDEDERFAAVAEVRRTRTTARQEMSAAGAEQLVGGTATNDPTSHSPPLAVRISTAGEASIDELHTQAAQAQETKQEARATRDTLQTSLKDLRACKDACRLKKKQAAEDLNQSRRAMKQTLLDLHARSDDITQKYRDNEILRLEDKRLDSDIEQMERQLAAAERACREIEAACEEWESHAKDQAQAVQNMQLQAAAEAVEMTAEALSAEAQNLAVGLRLLGKVHQDKASKVSCLERARQATDRRITALKEELRSPLCPSKAKKSKELLQNREKFADLDGRIRAFEASCQALAVTISTGESNRRCLEALTEHGFCFQAPELEELSTLLIEEAYPDLELPPEADEEEADEQADETQALALVSTSPDMMAMVRDTVRAMMLQEKADLEFRGKAQATARPSPTPAEAVTNWPPMPALPAAEEAEEAEGVSVEGNDAGKGGCEGQGSV